MEWPYGLLEGKGDPTPYIPLKGVTVTGKAKSKQPASFNYSLIPRSVMNGNFSPTTTQSLTHGILQIGGGLFSSIFSTATNKHLSSEGKVGEVIGEYFKFIVETGSNAASELAN